MPDSAPVDMARLACDLQSRGLRAAPGLAARRGGAGPAEGGALILGGRALSVPTASPFVATSPYSLAERDGRLVILRGEEEVAEVGLAPAPRFHDLPGNDGRPSRCQALLHGADCLATSVIQTCSLWDTPARCRFCGIELSLQAGRTSAKKGPDELGRLAAQARDLDGVNHVVLTTGMTRPAGAEVEHLAACARAISGQSGLPVHAQLMPPKSPAPLERLKAAGVATVGIHIESTHLPTLAAVAPFKAALGLTRYVRAWRWAVEIFGPGQVESFLVAGLGEPVESLIQGAALLADMGVYPFLVPLRPIPGSLMATALPPDPEKMHGLYQRVAAILQAKGLAHGGCLAGCVRCGACSALAYYELPPRDLICHPARTSAELDAARAIRERVFVAEQGMFAGSDRDPEDARAMHLVADLGGEVVGTVRVYAQADAHRHWWGGRLAVLPGRRARGAAELLVRTAVACAHRQGCDLFTALIQERNVNFFARLGWRAQGPPHSHHGRPHQLMMAPPPGPGFV